MQACLRRGSNYRSFYRTDGFAGVIEWRTAMRTRRKGIPTTGIRLLAALLSVLTTGPRSATVSEECVVELKAIPGFLLENDTDAKAEMAQWGQAHFDAAMAQARRAPILRERSRPVAAGRALTNSQYNDAAGLSKAKCWTRASIRCCSLRISISVCLM